ncbi:hypothetical protein ALC56_06725, partial [Trachymyrmex septentrionalis]
SRSKKEIPQPSTKEAKPRGEKEDGEMGARISACKVGRNTPIEGIPTPSLEETFVKVEESSFPPVRSDSTMGLQCRYTAAMQIKSYNGVLSMRRAC